MARKQTPDWQEDARKAAAAIKAGQILLHPTDTVWGLAADPKNDAAVRAMNRLKGRPENTPVLLLVADDGELERVLPKLPEGAWSLIESSDRPVTLVAEGATNRGFSVVCQGQDGRLAVRWVQDDPYTAYVIRGCGGVLASTSANLHGEATPARLDGVADAIRSGVGHVANHRREDSLAGRPSMMVGFDKAGRFEMIRS